MTSRQFFLKMLSPEVIRKKLFQYNTINNNFREFLGKKIILACPIHREIGHLNISETRVMSFHFSTYTSSTPCTYRVQMFLFCLFAFLNTYCVKIKWILGPTFHSASQSKCCSFLRQMNGNKGLNLW